MCFGFFSSILCSHRHSLHLNSNFRCNTLQAIAFLLLFCVLFFFRLLLRSVSSISGERGETTESRATKAKKERVENEINISQSLNYSCDIIIFFSFIFFEGNIDNVCIYLSLSPARCRSLARVYCFFISLLFVYFFQNDHQWANHTKSKIKIYRICVNKQITRSFRFIFYEMLSTNKKKNEKWREKYENNLSFVRVFFHSLIALGSSQRCAILWRAIFRDAFFFVIDLKIDR